MTREYVDSGIPWLGPIPVEWRTQPLWSMFTRVKDVDHPEEQMLSVFREFGVVAKDSRDNINQTAENRSIYQLVHPSWLVANRMKAWQGSVGISGLRGIVSGHYICFEPRHDSDDRFLNWLFRSSAYADGYALMSRGVRTGQAEIDNALYRTMPVLVPPSAEQCLIADYLDQETAQIDELIAEQQRLVQLLAERRTSLVDAALTYGFSRETETVSTKDPWLPRLPLGWKAVSTRRVLAFGPANGVSPEASGAADLKSLSLGAVRNGRVSRRDEVTKFVDRASVADVDGLRLHPGDILLVRGNGNVDLVARAGLVGSEFEADEYIYPDLLIRIRTNVAMLPEFFVWACNATATRVQVRALARTAVGTFKVSGGDVRSLVIPLPPLDDQHRIVAYLDEQTAKIDALVIEAERLIELARERRSALITAAVTGQIDARSLA